MKIDTVTHSVHRADAKIFNGFGFRHGEPGKICKELRQSVCEGILLYSALLNGIYNKNPEYCINKSESMYYLSIKVPCEWRDNQVVRKDIFFYKVSGNAEYTQVGAYDSDGKLIPGFGEANSDLYPLLPTVCLLIAIQCSEEPAFASMLDDYSKQIDETLLENIHSKFMDRFRNSSTFLSYGNVKEIGIENSTTSECLEQMPSPQTVKPENEHFDMNQFPEEFRDLIPHLGNEFELPDNLNGLCKALVSGDIRSVLLHGPAGTGKTISCKLMCQYIGIPLMDTVNSTENLDEFILGKYIPDGDKIVFMESYVTKAIRYGGAVVFEEINFAKPQYLAFLNSLMDDNGMVRLDSGEIVKRHPNFRLFATMNIGYFGTKELNQSLYNRFNAIVDVPELSDSAITKMLTTRVPECIPDIQHILSIYLRIKNKISSEELDVVISPRNLENWARLAKYEGYLEASEKTIIPIARSDKALENGLRGIIRMYKWDRSV